MLAKRKPTSPAREDESSTEAESTPANHPVPGFSGTIPKKRARQSKRDVVDYPFTVEHQMLVADFIKGHPALYDKRSNEWANPKAKEDLRKEVAANFEGCTHLQIKKLFDKKRTDFGKIEKKESKSGSAANRRTSREQSVVDIWGFLGGHIAHETTTPSDTFDPRPSTPKRQESLDYSSGRESAHSAASLELRNRMWQSTASPSTAAHSPQHVATNVILERLLEKADAISRPPTSGPDHNIRQFADYLCTRLSLVSPANHGLLFGKILEMVTCLEEPPAGATTVLKNPKKMLEELHGHPSPQTPKKLPAPQPPAQQPPVGPQPVYHQAQYQQLQYQPQHYQGPYYYPPQQPPPPTPTPQPPQLQQPATPWQQHYFGPGSPAPPTPTMSNLLDSLLKPSPKKMQPESVTINTQRQESSDEEEDT